MKKLYKALVVVNVLHILLTVVFIVISPDIIPVHYNFKGEADRFGSKYENLIFLFFSILMTGIMLLCAKYGEKKKAQEVEIKVTLYAAIFSVCLFMVLTLVFGLVALNYSEESFRVTADMVSQLTNAGIGVLVIVLSNMMPKARKNAVFGLRTKWSMASDAVWQKSQRFGGFSGVLCGVLMIMVSMMTPVLWGGIATLLLIVAWTIVCVVMSYKYWKEEQA